MSGLTLISAVLVSAGVVRQTFVLAAIVRTGRFLRPDQPARVSVAAGSTTQPRYYLVVPVLREAAVLRAAVAHLQAVASGHAATVLVVTTASEAAEADRYPAAEDTVAAARELARAGQCSHLHYPDRRGLKADQLNYAAAWCAGILPDRVPASQIFLVCYDADSRPPLDSLACLTQAISAEPRADVFHQSSRFEFRPSQRLADGRLKRLRGAICDAGALRANRFVLGFEIPRLLNRSSHASPAKRALCSAVYAHVTGHGLCVRLSLLEHLPFPTRSPLEDMHYSFILGSRGLPMVAVPSLDVAEVPGSVTAQVRQAARWFFGPGRFARYLKDPATRPGWRTTLMAASAFGSAAEWVGCAVVPALMGLLLVAGNPIIKTAAACYLAICLVQIIITEALLGTPERVRARLGRLAAFPLACAVHGAGGIWGWAQLLTGAPGAGKTERGPAA